MKEIIPPVASIVAVYIGYPWYTPDPSDGMPLGGIIDRGFDRLRGKC